MKALSVSLSVLSMFCLWTCATSSTSGGDATSSSDLVSIDSLISEPQGPKAEPCVPPENVFQPAITGSIYLDGDGKDQSLYITGVTPENDTNAEPRVLKLLGPEGERLIMSCEDGSFGVPSLPEGAYIVSPELTPEEVASTKNVSKFTYEALKSGNINFVTLGDSVPVQGGSPNFTTVLAQILQEFGNVNAENIAVGGTISENWVPGTSLFENSLRPLLPETDLVIISLGGNDLLHYVNTALSGGNIQSAIDDFEPFVLSVMDRVLQIADEIHATNPNVDVVYCLYPDYSDSDMWKNQFGFAHSFIAGKVVDALDIVRASIPAAHRFILMDMYGASKNLDLDMLLYDQLHFNTAGHKVYAEEIFRALGGARVGDTLGLEKNFGIYN